MVLLLVCDEEDDFVLFSDAVEVINIGARCIHASNGEEALALVRSMRTLPDAIFLEKNIKGMTALHCATRLRADAETVTIPIYICDKLMATAEDRHQYHELGIRDLVMNPSAFAATVETLRRVLL